MSDVQPSDAAVRVQAKLLMAMVDSGLSRNEARPGHDEYGVQVIDAMDAAKVCAGLLAVEYAALADKIEAARPHIPPSFDPKRREALIVRSTLNRVLGWVRAAAGGTP